jgi:lactate permease
MRSNKKIALDTREAGPLKLSYSVKFAGLHNQVVRVPPVEDHAKPEEAVYKFTWFSATGTGVLLACIVTALLLKQSLRGFGRSFVSTSRRMVMPLLAIVPMLGLAYITRYSGTDAILGLAFTRTGIFYPFFGTFLGWLGVALTGSDTASNALFGSLQKITSRQLGIDQVLMCSANSAGGVMGKMIDAQSIVVAATAANLNGQEGAILLKVLWHSVALTAIVGAIVLVYAYLLRGLIPHDLKLLVN